LFRDSWFFQFLLYRLAGYIQLPGLFLNFRAFGMGNLKKKRRLKMSKHKRRKRLKSNRHKKKAW